MALEDVVDVLEEVVEVLDEVVVEETVDASSPASAGAT